MKLFEFFSVPSVDDHESEKYKKTGDGQHRQQLSNDLYWYILDHDQLHKKHVIPIAHKLDQEYKKTKKIDKSKNLECWMPMVREACLEFHEKNKIPGDPKKIFDEEMCEHLCKRLADRYIEDIKKGEYKLG
jgi:hypothetical protein